ncbi:MULTISPECIES: amidohydrolase family protein [unclassified Streptomyces]|uniref:amidohydrolase family protein n=1 Tax=unclassified Streptomyces TaxID=2593676 RepID=UPI0004C7FF1D|nr:amidohydrolase family protein [Streptomyces sp. NRRL F-2747]
MTVTDWHAHLWPRAYVDFLDAHGQDCRHQRGVLPGDDSPAMLRRRVQQMDDSGMGRQVLNAAALYPRLAPPGRNAQAARLANEAMAEAVRTAPGRFAFLGVLPLPLVTASLRELDHLMNRLGARGIVLPPALHGRSTLGSHYDPLYAALDHTRATVLYHPAGTRAGPSLCDPGTVTWSVGAIAEQTTVVLDWLTADMSDRFPRVRPIITGAGGACFLLDPDTVQGVATSTLCFDSHTHGNTEALRLAGRHVGRERILLGTDYPFIRDKRLAEAVQQFQAVSFFSDESPA